MRIVQALVQLLQGLEPQGLLSEVQTWWLVTTSWSVPDRDIEFFGCFWPCLPPSFPDFIILKDDFPPKYMFCHPNNTRLQAAPS